MLLPIISHCTLCTRVAQRTFLCVKTSNNQVVRVVICAIMRGHGSFDIRFGKFEIYVHVVVRSKEEELGWL